MLYVSLAAGEEWTRFRGPNGTGVSGAKGIPTTWTEADFRWRVPVPGEGHSQPVIWRDHLYVLSATEGGTGRHLHCLQRDDGRIRWTRTFKLPTHRPGNANSSYSNSSQVVDATGVVACFVSADHFWVRSFDHEGREIWSHDLGIFNSQHGHGASPIIHEGLVIVTNDQREHSFLMALDRPTGRVVWQSPRRSQRGGTAYSTPVIFQRPGAAPEIIVNARSHGIASVDLKTGREIWEARVFDKRTCSSPVLAGDLIIGTCGKGGGGMPPITSPPCGRAARAM